MKRDFQDLKTLVESEVATSEIPVMEAEEVVSEVDLEEASEEEGEVVMSDLLMEMMEEVGLKVGEV